MNDMKYQVSMAGGNNSAADQLNKVQGFDPLKFLGRAAGETKAAAPHMDLRYKKLWFRLAYPKGRLKLIAQHITEQMAIFEAQIFLDRSDNEPVGNFIATCTVEDSPNYIEAAQEMALDAALSDAGFGVQFENGAGRPAPQIKAIQPAASVTAPPIRQTVTGTAKVSGSVAQQQNVQTGNPATVSQTAPQPALKVVDSTVRETGTPTVATSSPVSGTPIAQGPATEMPTAVKTPTATKTPTVTETLTAAKTPTVAKSSPTPGIPVAAKTPTGSVTQTLAENPKAAAPAADTGTARSIEPKPEYQESTAVTQMAFNLTAPSITEKVSEDMDSLPVAPRKPGADKAGATTSAEPIQISSYTQAAVAETSSSDTQVTSTPVASIPATPTSVPTTPATANTPVSIVQEQEMELPVAPAANGSAAPQVKYTKDTPIEEILQLMTFEEAQNVKVDIGTCNGWTMAQVAERRPPSLKWYVFGCKEGNNILRAAAQIMMESLSGKKAG